MHDLDFRHESALGRRWEFVATGAVRSDLMLIDQSHRIIPNGGGHSIEKCLDQRINLRRVLCSGPNSSGFSMIHRSIRPSHLQENSEREIRQDWRDGQSVTPHLPRQSYLKPSLRLELNSAGDLEDSRTTNSKNRVGLAGWLAKPSVEQATKTTKI